MAERLESLGGLLGLQVKENKLFDDKNKLLDNLFFMNYTYLPQLVELNANTKRISTRSATGRLEIYRSVSSLFPTTARKSARPRNAASRFDTTRIVHINKDGKLEITAYPEHTYRAAAQFNANGFTTIDNSELDATMKRIVKNNSLEERDDMAKQASYAKDGIERHALGIYAMHLQRYKDTGGTLTTEEENLLKQEFSKSFLDTVEYINGEWIKQYYTQRTIKRSDYKIYAYSKDDEEAQDAMLKTRKNLINEAKAAHRNNEEIKYKIKDTKEQKELIQIIDASFKADNNAEIKLKERYIDLNKDLSKFGQFLKKQLDKKETKEQQNNTPIVVINPQDNSDTRRAVKLCSVVSGRDALTS